MENEEKILVLDFGGQYNQLIARRVRDHHVYAEILPYTTPIEEIKASGYKGIIFTGGPNSVYDESSPHCLKEILQLEIPILGICYGCQLICYMEDGEVSIAPVSEYGKVKLEVCGDSLIFRDMPKKSTVWMSHADYISSPPNGFRISARTENCPCAAIENTRHKIYAVQFHPEVSHTEYGEKILKNFLYKVCGCHGEWHMDDFIERIVKQLRQEIGDKNVILGLSGGVDSSVVAALLSKVVGKKLTCVFVDHGLMRKDEGDMVENTFKRLFHMNFVRANCKDIFLEKLAGVSEPEEKRKIIGTEFYNAFWGEIEKQDGLGFFAQGTIYSDRIESGKGKAATIKTHHNQVKIPDNIKFEGMVEPLRDLFKDEVRTVGEKLGIPQELVWRQPFPGPGLGARIIGEITEDKIRVLQDADAIFREEMAKTGYEKNLSQFFAVLPDVKTVGVMGDHRTYNHLIALRAVTTDNFMTADWAKIPHDLLAKVSNRITNEVDEVNRVVYDITSKPPGTVEWE
ncbi:MAG: glutamine-hydrolyzing GMP synthase [Eggerthellaceae bacterium]|nr:glutamine-hydrolyzing GMP synthase [Eggerthellaceae bacterium]